ncbi:hypothetical protein BC831DRAFT_247514 [Entophlyctis helioformis]|nr:hypothetical protein BC831DRAFT_247514 [Entophlyctis helioformis]
MRPRSPRALRLRMRRSASAHLRRARPGRRWPRRDGAPGGLGDRAPPSQWQTVEQPVDVVLFEDWFLGFRPWTPEQTAQLFDRHQQHLHDGAGTLDPPAAMRSVFKYTQHNIAQVMESLAEYERSWYPLMDAFVHIAAEQTDVVYEWRWEQEECMRRDRGDATLGLTRSQVVDFVDRFFPLYELCLPRLLSNGFFEGGDGDGTKTGCCLQLVINRQRQLVSSSTK